MMTVDASSTWHTAPHLYLRHAVRAIEGLDREDSDAMEMLTATLFRMTRVLLRRRFAEPVTDVAEFLKRTLRHVISMLDVATAEPAAPPSPLALSSPPSVAAALRTTPRLSTPRGGRASRTTA